MTAISDGILDELLARRRLDDVAVFNLENLFGTTAHFMMGLTVGQIVRKKLMHKDEPIWTAMIKANFSSSSSASTSEAANQ